VALDGVGGHAGGGEASHIVLEDLRASVESLCVGTSANPDQQLRNAVASGIQSACGHMIELAAKNAEYEKMGTVFSLAFIANDTLFSTHVGDCRVYLARGRKLRQLTTDETFVQSMLDAGILMPDDVRGHPMRHIILNGVGTHAPCKNPDVRSTALQPGDRVVLTTDGVTDILEDVRLLNIISKYSDPNEAARELVRAALDGGGRDNASCVVVMIDPEGTKDMPRSDELRAELKKLHQMLTEVDEVDETIVGELTQVSEDIETVLQAKPAKASPEIETVRQKWQDFVVSFEASHPRLAGVIARITDALSGIGI
jgi:protein phosphatase